MADCALSILQDSTEPPGAASAVNRGAESAEHWEPQCDRSKGPGPCAFSGVTHLGPRRGKGERALLGGGASRAPKMRWRARLLGPHLGKYKVSKAFPSQREKRSKSGSGSGHRERDDRCWIQWTGWSFQEHQCPILSVKLISRKTIFQCGSFLVGDGGSGYVYWTSWFLWGGKGSGTDTTKGWSDPAVLGSVQGAASKDINQTHCVCFAPETTQVCSKPMGYGTLIPNQQRKKQRHPWFPNAMLWGLKQPLFVDARHKIY